LRQRRSPPSLTHTCETHTGWSSYLRELRATSTCPSVPLSRHSKSVTHVVCLCLSVFVCVCFCLFVSAQSSRASSSALSPAPVFACPGPPLVCARVCRFRSERGCVKKYDWLGLAWRGHVIVWMELGHEQSGRTLRSAGEAARFVALIEYQRLQTLGATGGRSEVWANLHSVLASRKVLPRLLLLRACPPSSVPSRPCAHVVCACIPCFMHACMCNCLHATCMFVYLFLHGTLAYVATSQAQTLAYVATSCPHVC
jgi:hypothetical protein